MARDQVRDPVHNDLGVYLVGGAVTLTLSVVGLVWAALRIGTDQSVPANPFDAVVQLFKGGLAWSGGATLVVFAAVALVVGALIGVVYLMRPRLADRTRLDATAKHMAGIRDVPSLTQKAVAAKARQLKVLLPTGADAGLPLALLMPSLTQLLSDYESLLACIAGPRTGKSTALVIPAVLNAPGAVITTSNKRDVVDATRAVRAARHGAESVWVFDPQQVAGEQPNWWWDPLSWVSDDVKAAQLAKHFADGEDGEDAAKQPFWDDMSKDLLTALILAAAKAHLPITHVYTWVSDDTDQTPVMLLREHGYDLVADGLQGHYDTTEKTRSGIFAGARRMVATLKYSHVQPWIARTGPHDTRPHFDPRAFIASNGTLYSLSMEGSGSAGPLVTALTVAVIEAASEQAIAHGGRLDTPMVCALDEIANVVRWGDLPNLYSHYGSRGIIVWAILQSYAQGIELWRRNGMDKLWGAANIKLYLGGATVASDGFLRDLSVQIGEHSEITGSVTSSSDRSGRSTSRNKQYRRTLTEAELAALPRGRAILLSSGNAPALVKTVPWWDTPHGNAVHSALAAIASNAQHNNDDSEESTQL